MMLSPKINFLMNVYVHVENLSCYHRWSNKSYPHHFEGSTMPPVAKKHLAWYKAFRKRHFFDREYEDAFSSGSLEHAVRRLKHMKSKDKKPWKTFSFILCRIFEKNGMKT